MKQILFLILITTLIFSSCDSSTVATTSANALVGNYVISSLQANVAVDLNADLVSSTDLLQEATCLQQMNVSFNADGTFTTLVTDVNFNASNILLCTPSTETGTYTYVNGVLSLTTNVNGGTVTESQVVVLTPTTFSFTFGGARINQLFSDLSTTPAGGITTLNFVYTRI